MLPFLFFFFNDTATTEIYTLSLHDALPIYWWPARVRPGFSASRKSSPLRRRSALCARSEEHTSELQSRSDLVCRLLLEKKKKSKQKSLSLDILCTGLYVGVCTTVTLSCDTL